MGIISFLSRLFGKTDQPRSISLPEQAERAPSPSIRSHQTRAAVVDRPIERIDPVAPQKIDERPQRRPRSSRTHPRVPSAWTQLPTLAIGGAQQVVGEQNYQAALKRLSGGRDTEGTLNKYATACLVREPENSYDSNAVRVDIGGNTVGYLPRNETMNFHELLKGIESSGGQATCRARFLGGWYRGADDQGSIGVTLDLSRPPALWRPDEIYLPADKSISLVGERAHQAHLSAIVGQLSDGVTVGELREIVESKGNRISAFVQGVEVGHLSAASLKAYQPSLQELHAAGVRATCVARITSGPKGYEVVLMLPET